MELEGQVALVTGASRGIGRAIALGLAADGADVAVNYRKNKVEADRTVSEIRELGRRAEAFQGDVALFDQVKAMMEAIMGHFGGLNVMVNNAGVSSRGRKVADTELSDLERVIAAIALGSHHVCQLALPHLRENERSSIIFISSEAAVQHNAFGAPYNMAKAAQESLAYTLAKEEARKGVRVNIVSPGLVNTDMGRGVAKAAAGADDIHDLDKHFALGRVNEPEDVAALVRFLVSDAATQITGQRISVDAGGMQ